MYVRIPTLLGGGHSIHVAPLGVCRLCVPTIVCTNVSVGDVENIPRNDVRLDPGSFTTPEDIDPQPRTPESGGMYVCTVHTLYCVRDIVTHCLFMYQKHTIYVYEHTYVRTYTYTYCICKHTYAHTHTQARMHARTHARTHMHTPGNYVPSVQLVL